MKTVNTKLKHSKPRHNKAKTSTNVYIHLNAPGACIPKFHKNSNNAPSYLHILEPEICVEALQNMC